MKKILSILMFVTLMVSGANAISTDSLGTAGFNGLDPVAQAEVLKMVAEKAQAQKQAGILDKVQSNPEKVNQWIEIGSNIGKGLAGAAKELGVEANNFATTPVGQLTIWLIVWHIMGQALMHFVGAFITWIVGFLGIWFIRTAILDRKESLSGEARAILGAMSVVVFIIGIIVMVTF